MSNKPNQRSDKMAERHSLPDQRSDKMAERHSLPSRRLDNPAERNGALTRRMCRLACLAALAAAVGGCSLLPSEEQPLKPPLVKPAEARIVTVEPTVGTMERSVAGSATFESVHMAYHRFTESGGRVEDILVRSGDEVKAGDTLLRLDTGSMQMTLLQRQLEVERKLLALDEAKATGDARRIKIANLDLEIAGLLLASIEDTLANKELRAEIDGFVTFAADLEPGDIVQEYQTLFTISDPEQLRLSFYVTFNSAVSEVQVGMVAEVVYDGQTYAGKVVQTPASAPFMEDERLRERYATTLYVEIDELPDGVELGDSASVRIVTAKAEQAMMLPKSGVRKAFGRTFVQILEGEGRRELDIETGLENATHIQIISGIEPGVQVVLQ